MNHPNIPKHNSNANIHSVDELIRMNRSVKVLIVDNVCSDKCLTVLDLSSFSELRVFEVGDECFKNVDEVKLIGLNQLERVVIGENCFTKHKNDCSYSASRHFYLKDCRRLRELKMGCDSFRD